MKLDSIELLNEGYHGVKVVGVEAVGKDGATILIPTTKTYPLPLPVDLIAKIKKLKRYMLEMTNHWWPEFNEHLAPEGYILDRKVGKGGEDINYVRAKNIWDSTTMMKIYKRKGGYILSGKMESPTSRFFSITTPLIDPEDDFDNFSKMQTGIEYCFAEVASFIDDKHLRMMDPVQYAKQLFGENSDEADRVQNMAPKDRAKFMIATLESKGYIVLGQDDVTITEKQIPEKTQDSAKEPTDEPVEEPTADRRPGEETTDENSSY